MVAFPDAVACGRRRASKRPYLLSRIYTTCVTNKVIRIVLDRGRPVCLSAFSCHVIDSRLGQEVGGCSFRRPADWRNVFEFGNPEVSVGAVLPGRWGR